MGKFYAMTLVFCMLYCGFDYFLFNTNNKFHQFRNLNYKREQCNESLQGKGFHDSTLQILAYYFKFFTIAILNFIIIHFKDTDDIL